MTTTLAPLPQSVIAAAALRRMAKDLILQAEALESEAGVNDYRPTRHVEFEFSKKKIAERKPTKSR
ncbi:MAG: hypothetical protein HGA69_00400 [Desulfobulbaceae bacterium]|nr:hypothetical protein [Desulfobulbaceae bacterium]